MSSARINRKAVASGPSPKVKSSRRSSILKKPNLTTPDKENGSNMAMSRRKSSIGGGDKKRRVSFSQNPEVFLVSPAKQNAGKNGTEQVEKRVALQPKEPEHIPRLQDLLDDSAIPQFGVSTIEDQPPLDKTFGGTDDWNTRNFNVTIEFTGQPPLPPSHVMSIDSIFGGGIDESAIYPRPAVDAGAAASEGLQTVNFANQSMELVEEEEEDGGQQDLRHQTIDKWGVQSVVDAEKEMELTRAASHGPGLDSKTFDTTDAMHWGKTVQHEVDMSLVEGTAQHEMPKTVAFTAEMSGVVEEDEEEEEEVEKSVAMDVEDDIVQEPDVVVRASQEPGAKTVNFATDMELTGEHHEMDVEDEEEAQQDAPSGSHEELNQGFTNDWAQAGGVAGTKTVNFAAPMEIVNESDEEDVEDGSSNASIHWGIKSFDMDMSGISSGHLAAADAVRKSLEMGEARTSQSRKSLDRKSIDRVSFGRNSLTPSRRSLDGPVRESLNRSSLPLSPVEETAEMEEVEQVSEVVVEPVATQLVVPAPAPVSASLKTEEQRVGLAAGRVMVSHPIAGIPVAAPASKLPGLFDRRYSTRRIIQNFGQQQHVVLEDDAEPEPVLKAARNDQSVDDSNVFESRRVSMRQSIAPNELPIADFLWLANVRFAEEQPVSLDDITIPSKPTLHQAEFLALQQELAELSATAQSLKGEIEALEDSLTGTSHPLFSAIQTSDQAELETLQLHLAGLKRLCLVQAETATLADACRGAAAVRTAFRGVGERAIRDTRTVYQLVSKLRDEREELRTAKISTMTELCRLRDDQRKRSQQSSALAASAKFIASAAKTLTNCTVHVAKADHLEMDICGFVKMSVVFKDGSFSHSCTMLDGLTKLRRNVVRAMNVCTMDTAVVHPAGKTLRDVVEPVRSRVLRVNACCNELKMLSRRYNIVYGDEAAEIYFASKGVTAVLRLSASEIASYPMKLQERGPTLTILKGQASSHRLFSVMNDAPTGLGYIGSLCQRIASEIQKL